MKDLVLTDPLPDMFLPLAKDRCQLCLFESADDSQYQQATGMIVYGHHRIDDAVLDRCKQLRVISNHGVGVDHIDVAAAQRRGIAVGHTPGCVDAATADMTMALILATARNMIQADHFARSPAFTAYNPNWLIGQEVSGSTLGIIGLGRIGRQVARRATAFDMPCLYHNRNRQLEAEATLGVQYRALDDLLRESDFVALNCPLTAETTHLISQRELAMMKPSAILINCARGAVVDTDALVEALQDHAIRAAGLDVTDPEPLPRDHPLLSLDNVIIMPHLGSATNRTRERMMQRTMQNLFAGLDGLALPWQVPTIATK
ncbi:MAG: D-glycerate dehydrogenase [Pirellulaceae bacterium]